LKVSDLSEKGIDFATDNGYLSPVVQKAAKECKLVMTTKFKSTQKVTLPSGYETSIAEIREQMQQKPIRHDARAGAQAYYWRTEVSHPYLGMGTLVIQKRKLRSGGFQYHYHFSQLKNAKAITVLQIAARRWPIEVFFREAKQHLGLNHLPYRKWPSLRGHIAVRGLLYFLFRRRNATKASMETMPKNSWRLKTPLQRRIFSYFP
jgi:hypothetical protein